VPVPCVDWDRRVRGGLRVRRWVECAFFWGVDSGFIKELLLCTDIDFVSEV
jgi:hypothetical protein